MNKAFTGRSISALALLPTPADDTPFIVLGAREQPGLPPFAHDAAGFAAIEVLKEDDGMVDEDSRSTDFVARTHRDSAVESQKYVCFLCAGTFVHGDRNHFKRNRSNGHWVWDGTVDNRIGHRFIRFPCCVDANHSWKNHEQQSVVHSVPNLKENTEWKNPRSVVHCAALI